MEIIFVELLMGKKQLKAGMLFYFGRFYKEQVIGRA